MSEFDSEVEVLKELGLTNLQARLYGMLVRFGQSSIGVISKSGQFDRAEAYRGLSELERIGLVQKIIASPFEYKALPMRDGLQLLLDGKTRELAEVTKKTGELIKKTTIFDDEKGSSQGSDFIYVPDNEAMYRHFLKRFESSFRSVDAVAYSEVLERFIYEDVIFTRAIKEGMKVRFLTNKFLGEQNLDDSIRKLKGECDLQVRYIPRSAITPMRIIDDREVFVSVEKEIRFGISKSPPNLWSNNENFVAIAKAYFEQLWRHAKRKT